MTYLEIINKVMRRMREQTVGSVSENAYSLMIGEFVNDAKRAVEDAWAWRALIDSVQISTVAGTYTYNLDDHNCILSGAPPRENARLYIEPQNSFPMIKIVTSGEESELSIAPPSYQFVEFQQMINQDSRDRPNTVFFNVNPLPNSGASNMAITLSPIPDGVYDIRLYVVNPQNDLVDDDEVIFVPSFPVIQLAYLYALYERGEEVGEALTLTSEKADKALSDAISFDSSSTSEFIFRPN